MLKSALLRTVQRGARLAEVTGGGDAADTYTTDEIAEINSASQDRLFVSSSQVKRITIRRFLQLLLMTEHPLFPKTISYFRDRLKKAKAERDSAVLHGAVSRLLVLLAQQLDAVKDNDSVENLIISLKILLLDRRRSAVIDVLTPFQQGNGVELLVQTKSEFTTAKSPPLDQSIIAMLVRVKSVCTAPEHTAICERAEMLQSQWNNRLKWEQAQKKLEQALIKQGEFRVKFYLPLVAGIITLAFGAALLGIAINTSSDEAPHDEKSRSDKTMIVGSVILSFGVCGLVISAIYARALCVTSQDVLHCERVLAEAKESAPVDATFSLLAQASVLTQTTAAAPQAVAAAKVIPIG